MLLLLPVPALAQARSVSRSVSPDTTSLWHFTHQQWSWRPSWWRSVRAYTGNWVSLQVVGGQWSHLATLFSPTPPWASSHHALGDEHQRNLAYFLLWLCAKRVIPNGRQWFHLGWVVAFIAPHGTSTGWSQWGADARWGLGHGQDSTARRGVAQGNPGSHIPATEMPAKLFRTWLSTETNTNEVNVSFENLRRTSNQVLYPFLSYRLIFYFTFINQIVKQRAGSSINQNRSIEVNSTAMLF